jgi:hypothetical protein
MIRVFSLLFFSFQYFLVKQIGKNLQNIKENSQIDTRKKNNFQKFPFVLKNDKNCQNFFFHSIVV